MTKLESLRKIKNLIFYEYSIKSSYSLKIEPFHQEVWQKSLFILASNDLEIEPQEIIDVYKNQFVVERGFRFIKSPEFLADSLYLKKLERIEALLFIMTLSLMVYASLERKIRTSFKKMSFLLTKRANPHKRLLLVGFFRLLLIFIFSLLEILNKLL